MNVKDTVLANSLKELVADGIVRKEIFPEIPPRTEYELTEKGASVVPILQSICHWSSAFHREASENAPAQCLKCDYGGLAGE